jgi:hypothetical protein
MKFIKFYSVAFFKMKILCKFTSFSNFLFLEAAATATAGAAAPPRTSLTYRKKYIEIDKKRL